MKILIISYDFYPNIGGVAQHVFNLAKNLSKIGHDVTVFTLRYDFKSNFEENIEGIKVYRFLTLDIPKLRGIIFLIQALIFGFFYSLFYKIDVLHSHTVIPDSLCGIFIFSKKKVFTNHSSQFLELYESTGKNLTKFLYKTVLNFFDVIIAPSIELKEKSEKFFNKKPFYVSNGVDIEKFYPLTFEEKQNKKELIFKLWNLEERKFIIFCPRRLEPKNGVEFFVEALKFLKDKRSDFWGIISGNEYIPEYAQKIKNLIRDLNLSNYVLFTGPILHEEIVNYYQASDLVVLPSLYEATSISGLEALACGVPVIGTKVGGIPYIIKDGINGILVEPKNSKEISESMLYLLEKEDVRLKMSKIAREIIVQNFSWNKIVIEIEKIYSSKD